MGHFEPTSNSHGIIAQGEDADEEGEHPVWRFRHLWHASGLLHSKADSKGAGNCPGVGGFITDCTQEGEHVQDNHILRSELVSILALLGRKFLEEEPRGYAKALTNLVIGKAKIRNGQNRRKKNK